MKKKANLFKELGFKKSSAPDVQRAFFKHLVRATDRSTQQNPNLFSEQISKSNAQPTTKNEQLSFDLEILKAGNG